MIYVSSSCVKATKIRDSVEALANYGFRHIELSGGTIFYSSWAKDLVELKERFRLEYLVHNYFPPAHPSLVVNLASNDQATRDSTLDQIYKSLEFSKTVGAKKFGFHAGFFVEIGSSTIGQKLSNSEMKSVADSTQFFCEGYRKLAERASELGVKLYIENNVYSQSNYEIFGNKKPFMLLDSDDFLALKQEIDFEVLIDIAHLKVSCKTLRKDFQHELVLLAQSTDYVHVSANNGLEDQNEPLTIDCEELHTLRRIKGRNLDVTLEVYSGLADLKESYDLVQEVLS